MGLKKLREYLDGNHIKYVVLSHSLAYSAQEVAASVHIPGKEVAKTVLVNVNGKLVMAVLPANYNINFNRLMIALGGGDVFLAPENELLELFPDCELGAMPPFGNLYNMEVFVAKSLAEDEEIAFNAGSHTEIIKMDYKDFAQMVEPKEISFTTRFDKKTNLHHAAA
jgi:Ala-tRNA(Pro) deacylase